MDILPRIQSADSLNPIPQEATISVTKIRAYHEAFLALVEMSNNGTELISNSALDQEQIYMINNLLIGVPSGVRKIVLKGKDEATAHLLIDWNILDPLNLRLDLARFAAQTPLSPENIPNLPRAA